ncbi:MAG: hypothetical protein BRC45_15440, partial [Cyanobacteria bacterium QS_5_48_63]
GTGRYQAGLDEFRLGTFGQTFLNRILTNQSESEKTHRKSFDHQLVQLIHKDNRNYNAIVSFAVVHSFEGDFLTRFSPKS